jgi:hypothetical protein
MVSVYTTHKFLFTLAHEGTIKGHRIEFTNREGNLETIVVERIEIGTSPISCKLYCSQGKRHVVPFVRIKKIFKDDELVWDASDVDTSNVKIIKGHTNKE